MFVYAIVRNWFPSVYTPLCRRWRPIINNVGWQTSSAAVISATGIVQAKRQAKVLIKKLRKSLNPNWLYQDIKQCSLHEHYYSVISLTSF